MFIIFLSDGDERGYLRDEGAGRDGAGARLGGDRALTLFVL
jgi:hypothetical protein